jgi:hypothetical protein
MQLQNLKSDHKKLTVQDVTDSNSGSMISFDVSAIIDGYDNGLSSIPSTFATKCELTA